MRNWPLIPVVAGILLSALIAAPAFADNGDECVTAGGWLSGASRDFLGIDFMDPDTGSAKTAQDYIETGNYYRCRCEHATDAYYQRMQTSAGQVLQSRYGVVQPTGRYEPPAPENKQMLREIAKESGVYKTDPQLEQYERSMIDLCNAANRNYAAALDMTPADDYLEQAKIYDSIAGVYETTGYLDDADDARQEALDARVRAEAKGAGFESDCLIVTAAFGSPMATEVQLVRDFRDNTIKQEYLGSRYVTALNAIYYSFSPYVASAIDRNPSVKPAMRVILAPLLGIVLLSQELYLLLGFCPEVATAAFIIVGGALVGLVYIMPVMLSAFWVAARRQWQVPGRGSLKSLCFLWSGLLAALAIGAVTRADFISVLSSGMLFVCTVLLVAFAAALYISCRLGILPAAAICE